LKGVIESPTIPGKEHPGTARITPLKTLKAIVSGPFMTARWFASMGDMRAPHRILRVFRGEMCGMHISDRSGQDVL
jgi:hypothetical protein